MSSREGYFLLRKSRRGYRFKKKFLFFSFRHPSISAQRLEIILDDE
jgi:hypothetical protein